MRVLRAACWSRLSSLLQTLIIFPLFYRLACGIIARSAGLFQNPKQICACDGVTLWEERDRPIAGKGRSKANAETPAAHLWTEDPKTKCICSPLWVSGWAESAPWRDMQRMKRGRQSTEEYVSRQLEWWPKKSGLIFSKCFSVEIKHFYICSLCPLRILKALKQTETALGVFAKVTSD